MGSNDRLALSEPQTVVYFIHIWSKNEIKAAYYY